MEYRKTNPKQKTDQVSVLDYMIFLKFYCHPTSLDAG